ncbi:hypothetical protein Tco_1082104 [Tanacetum coccineum]|uniref:Uncharacterized protein n=1 Tax=Tanacetum coccineum TaxID=301880 RepID=A0ABQ5I0A7_9ASTR
MEEEEKWKKKNERDEDGMVKERVLVQKTVYGGECGFRSSIGLGQWMGCDIDLVLIQVNLFASLLLWAVLHLSNVFLPHKHLDDICAKILLFPRSPSSNCKVPDATLLWKTKLVKDGMLHTWMNLNAFIRTADPRKVRIVERPRAENERPIITVAKHRTVGPKHSKKKRVIYDSEGLHVASHPPKRLRADYGTTGGSVTGASPLERGAKDSTDSVTGPPFANYRVPSTMVRVLYDFFSSLRSLIADLEVDSIVWSAASGFMTRGFSVATTVAISTNVRNKIRVALHHRSGFDAGSIRAEEVVGAGSEEIYIPELTVTRGFELNDGPASNLSLSLEVRMRAEYNILEKRKWRSLAEEKNILLEPKDKEIEDLNLVNQVRELEISSTDLREKLEMYEGILKQLEGFSKIILGTLRTGWPEIDADFHPVLYAAFSREVFHPTLSQRRCGREGTNSWDKLLVDGLAAGIEHGQAGRCLTDLEAYIPSAEDDFNSAIRDLRDLNFLLLQELSNNKDASTWDIMDLLRLDRLCMINVSAEVPATNVLSTVVIVPHADPSVSVEDYDNPDSADVVPENATLGSESEGKIDASAGGGLTLSQLDDEARDAIL